MPKIPDRPFFMSVVIDRGRGGRGDAVMPRGGDGEDKGEENYLIKHSPFPFPHSLF